MADHWGDVGGEYNTRSVVGTLLALIYTRSWAYHAACHTLDTTWEGETVYEMRKARCCGREEPSSMKRETL